MYGYPSVYQYRKNYPGSAASSGLPQTAIYIDYNPNTLGLTNGASIATLTDSVAGRNATGAASKPTFVTNAINTTLPVINFASASGQYFTLPNLSALTAGTCHVVVKVANDPPSDATKSGLWLIGTVADNTYFPLDTGIVYDGFGSTTRQTVGNPTPSLATFGVYSVWSAANDWAAYWNGTQLFSTAINTVGFSAAPTLGRAFTTTNFLDGQIARMIMYSTKQSAGDFSSTVSFLKTTYGIA